MDEIVGDGVRVPPDAEGDDRRHGRNREEGAVIDAGKVTLRTRNIRGKQHADAKYIFEIENAKGDMEKSEPIAAGDKETKWTPKMEVKAGQKYTWRVKAVDGKWTGPVADTSFKGKSTP